MHSGRIHTARFSFYMAGWKLKAKCPAEKVLACFWMLPAEEGLPFGEIDIMEYIDCWSSKGIRSMSM